MTNQKPCTFDVNAAAAALGLKLNANIAVKTMRDDKGFTAVDLRAEVPFVAGSLASGSWTEHLTACATGFSKCNPSDRPDIALGTKIAFGRAAKRLSSIIKQQRPVVTEREKAPADGAKKEPAWHIAVRLGVRIEELAEIRGVKPPLNVSRPVLNTLIYAIAEELARARA